MGDELDFRRVFLWGAVDGDEDALLVRDNVGVCENTVFSDQESGADTSAETTGIPWRFIIRGENDGRLG